MRIIGISLQNFRNIELERLSFDPDQPVFLVGRNGQGKSNLLEALSLVTAIRSFRTYDVGPLVRRGQSSSRLIFRLLDEEQSEVEVDIRLASRQRSVEVDGTGVARLGDFVGRFPSVVFCSDDTQMFKGGPQIRRRYFDLFYSVLDRSYLEELQAYHRALKERNNALKKEMGRAMVSAYDPILAERGARLMEKRRHWTRAFAALFVENYRKIAPEEEQGTLKYRVSMKIDDVNEYLKKLAEQFSREQALGSTSIGPHRDDFVFSVKDIAVKSFGSDGQQRSVALALKLAQIELTEQTIGRKPVVLLDDILGELDDERKQRFWRIFDHDCQVIATGTQVPGERLKAEWVVYEVENGKFVHQG